MMIQPLLLDPFTPSSLIDNNVPLILFFVVGLVEGFLGLG